MAKGSQPNKPGSRSAAVKPPRAAPPPAPPTVPVAARGFGTNVLHLVALTSFALAQPLFDLLSRNSEFFVAHHSQPNDILLFVLLACAAVPALLAGLEFVVGLAYRPARDIVHAALIAILVAATLMPPLKRMSDTSALVVPAALLAGGIAAVAVSRVASVRNFLAWLSPAPLLFAGVFLFGSPVAKLLSPGSGAALAVKVGAPAPVVMLVFDEFSQISLLDERGLIDEVRYPNIAALARDSTWYRDASTVSYHTELAVPALLSGLYPAQGRLQTATDYPNNLFTLLGGTYDMAVTETVTRLCPPALCEDTRNVEAAPRRLAGLLSDIAVLYLHIVLPRELEAALPSVSDRWAEFASKEVKLPIPEPATHQTNTDPPALQAALKHDRVAVFNRFLSGIHAADRPTLFFLHLLLPHTNWRYLPSGKDYSTFGTETFIEGWHNNGVWGDDEWLVTQGFQRYLLQVGFTDRLVGQLVARLKEVGIYDDALLVIVADHGVSTIANEARRGPGPTGYPELLLMPLFIKTPHQRDGAISDRNVQIIDVLPTVASILQVHMPFAVDGHSVVDPSTPEPTEKRLLVDSGPPKVFDSKLEARTWNLQRQIALFGTGTSRPDGLYRIGPHTELIGRAITDAERENTPGMEVRVDYPDIFLDLKPDGPFAPAYITGRLRMRDVPEPFDVAVAVNGTIAGVTHSYRNPSNELRFKTIVPETVFRAGDNDVQVYLVSDRDGGLRLQHVAPTAAGR